MITIKQIAQLADVSPTTVSNVIHGRSSKISQEKMKKVQALLKEYNYMPKLNLESLVRGRTKLIVVLLRYEKNYKNTIISDPFFGTLIGVLEKCIKEIGYFMMLSANNDLQTIFQHALSWDISGMICISLTHKNYLKLAGLLDCPLVGIDIYDTDSQLPDDGYYVSLDDFDAGYQMGRYLASCGFRNIICIAEWCAGPAKFRQMGMKKALEESHIPVYPHSFPCFPLNAPSYTSYYERFLSFMGKGYVISCCSDQLAFDLMCYIYRHGYKVPDDISLTGFDDNIYATVGMVKLTTVHQDIPEKARQAVALLKDAMEDPVFPKQNRIVPAYIVKRESIDNHSQLYGNNL